MKKRFVEIDDGLDFSIKHIESGEIFYDCESIVDILNELSEENQSLKFQLDECQNHKLFSRRELEKENEQLKRQDKINEDCYKELLQKYDNLKKENEELKKEVENLKQAVIRAAFDMR